MNNMKSYTGSKKGAARFVRNLLQDLKPDYVLITTTVRELSEDSYVSTAIVGSSADIAHQAAKHSSRQPQNTFPVPTPDT